MEPRQHERVCSHLLRLCLENACLLKEEDCLWQLWPGMLRNEAWLSTGFPPGRGGSGGIGGRGWGLGLGRESVPEQQL